MNNEIKHHLLKSFMIWIDNWSMLECVTVHCEILSSCFWGRIVTKHAKKTYILHTLWYSLHSVHLNIHWGYSIFWPWGCFLRKHLVLTASGNSFLRTDGPTGLVQWWLCSQWVNLGRWRGRKQSTHRVRSESSMSQKSIRLPNRKLLLQDMNQRSMKTRRGETISSFVLTCANKMIPMLVLWIAIIRFAGDDAKFCPWFSSWSKIKSHLQPQIQPPYLCGKPLGTPCAAALSSSTLMYFSTTSIGRLAVSPRSA